MGFPENMAGQKNDLSCTGDGRQDGKSMTGLTDIFKAKL